MRYNVNNHSDMLAYTLSRIVKYFLLYTLWASKNTFKGQFFHIISTWPYLIIFFVFFFFGEQHRFEQATAYLVLGVLSLTFSILLFRRIQLFESTAPAPLNSSAQGYCLLEGKVSLHDKKGQIIHVAHHDLPTMVWFNDGQRQSSNRFLLSDNEGFCTVDPSSAEVIATSKIYADKHFNAIFPDETIYIFGYLKTLRKQRTEYEKNNMVSTLIAKWKKDSSLFLDCFDKNKDGAIDEAEMKTARASAVDITDQQMEEVYKVPATHIITNPNDGRPFLITSTHPEKLILRYKRAMLVHTALWVLLSVLALAMQVY